MLELKQSKQLINVYNNRAIRSAILNVAVIGLGHQAIEDHIPAVLLSRDVKLVAVVDVDSRALAGFKKSHPEVKCYKTVEGMLKNSQVDFAIVCTPHIDHFSVCKLLLEKGVHILKEKPLAASYEEAVLLAGIARKHKRELAVTLQRRFNPIYSTFPQLLRGIGKVFLIEGTYTFFTDTPGEGWRGKKKTAGGGCLIDMGYHMIDLLIWYFGLPDSVIACASCLGQENKLYDAEDTVRVTFKYRQTGMNGSILISRSISPKQESLIAFGTRGQVRMERGLIERFDEKGQLIESLKRENNWPSAALDQLNYFVKVVKGEAINLTSAEAHLDHMAFVESAYLSITRNGYVDPQRVRRGY
ncbi:MAG: Gfo/Idh/MocA family oxidoreductase [bacterium]|nr:Gfo/Idh/MocA family oxidoreductase [bacterium]